jgi:hypothetical protein
MANRLARRANRALLPSDALAARAIAVGRRAAQSVTGVNVVAEALKRTGISRQVAKDKKDA